MNSPFVHSGVTNISYYRLFGVDSLQGQRERNAYPSQD
jgi:hypothetical protein